MYYLSSFNPDSYCGYITMKISEISEIVNKIDTINSIGITCDVSKRIGIISIENIGTNDSKYQIPFYKACVVFKLKAR